MASAIEDPAVAAAVDALHASLDVLLAAEWTPAVADEALVRVREIEAAGRRFHAVQLQLQDRIERSGVHKADGHASAKVMVRHGANLSNAAALRREQVLRMSRDLPLVGAEHAAGRIGTPQMERIARVHGNERVREQLIEIDAQLAIVAARLPYRELDATLTDWERVADQDGAGDRAAKAHASRDLRMPRNLDGGRHIEGGCGTLDGEVVAQIWERQIQREFEQDWAEARVRLGSAATVDDLARTDAQRRFDAWKALAVRGDASAEVGGERTCTDLVVDQVTHERHLARLFGADPGPDPRLATWWDDVIRTTGIGGEPRDVDPASADPAAADPAADDTDDAGAAGPAATADAALPSGGGELVGFRCSTVDGHPLDPTEVVVASLIGQVRRVVAGSDGVVLDMGRRARFFTGARQLAVRLSHQTCAWPGCDVPSPQCQCDHLEGFHGPDGGSTHPGNGAPTCGRHNRHKKRGFTIRRDARGRWHVHRPDGTEIT